MKLSLAIISAFLVASSASAVIVRPKPKPETTCGKELASDWKEGKALPWINGGPDPFYVADSAATGNPGACGNDYYDSSMVVCVGSGWIHPLDHSVPSHCDNWVEIVYGDKTIQARIGDSCGDNCENVYFTKRIMEFFGGEAAVNLGHLPGSVKWRLLPSEPFWGCEAGIPGKTVDGKIDTCQGKDQWGCARNGRKSGDNRVIGPKVFQQCPAFPGDGKVAADFVQNASA